MKLFFIGQSHRKIKNGKILLPEEWLDKLIGKIIYLAAATDPFTHLKLIPDSNLSKVEREIEFELSEISETQVTYIGAVKLRKDAALFIPKKARILSSLPYNGDVVILGIYNYIEICNKEDWDSYVSKIDIDFIKSRKRE